MAALGVHIVELREKFQDYSTKFSSFARENSTYDSEHLNKLVEELIIFTQKVPSDAVIYPDYDIILTSLGTLVSVHKLDLLVKSCEFVCYLVAKHNVKLRKELIETMFNLCCQGLSVIKTPSDTLQVLKAMETLLQADLNHALEKYTILSSLASPSNGKLIHIISDNEVNGQLLLAAVGCLELLLLQPSLTVCSEVSVDNQPTMDEIFETCMQALISVLSRGKPDDLDDLGYCKLVIASMRGLHHLLSPVARTSVQSTKVLMVPGRLAEMVGIVRAFLAVGLPGAPGGVKYPVGPFKAHTSSLVLPVTSQELEDNKDGYKGRTTKALKKNRKKTSKKGVDILVDSLGDEKSDLPQRSVKPGSTLARLEPDDPKLPHWNLTSDSDLSSSDVESGRLKDSEGRSAFSKVRQMACSLLLCVIKVTEPNVLLGFWPCLLPDGMPTGPGHPLPTPLKIGEQVTLATLMLRDPASKGRALAAMVLASLLTSWQRFLTQAECSRDKRTMSFTPFSIALGWSVCSLHRHICLAFSSEVSPNSLLQLLRCSAALVLASSYHKLSPGLLNRLVAAARPLLRHRDKSAAVQVAVFNLFGAVVALDPTPPEVVQIFSRSSSSKLLENSGVAIVTSMPENETVASEKALTDEEDVWDNEYYEDEDESLNVVGESNLPSGNANQAQGLKSPTEPMPSKGTQSLPWIVEVCLSPLSLRDRSAPIPVQTECLQVLSSIARNQDLAPKLILHSEFWPILQTRFIIGPGVLPEGEESFPLKYHWAKFWESLGLAIRRCLELEGEPVLTLSQAVSYWQALLSGTSLVSLIQDMDTPSLRTVGCDVLAAIGATVFGHFMRDKQILCETLLFGSSRDEEPSVKSAALRALGVYSLYPSLREDLHFLLDTSDTLQSALEGDPGRGEVWVKASWALGTLSDALTLNKEEGLADDIPDGPLLDLLETCAVASQRLPKGGSSGDRVRCNAVRAAGNIVRLVDFRGWDEMAGNMSLFSLGKRGKDAAEKVAFVLVEAATKSCDMKVRWNACYAISSMLKNHSLYENSAAFDDLVTKSKVFPSLCSLVRDFRNLKVRISAALALSSPRLHSNYGQRHFIEAWKALLEGLDNSQRSGLDMAGYNHQSNLIDQIVLTLCHLAKLVERGDLSLLGEILDPHLENAQSQMIRRSHTLVPEKASLIAEAASYLASMKKSESNCLTKIEDESLSKLLRVFSTDEHKDFNVSYPF